MRTSRGRSSTALHGAYLQATTASFAGIVACQIGTAFASRTQHASLRRIGLTSNRLLLAGIAFELVFAAAVIYLPPLQALFGTAALPAWVLATLLPMPVLVWASTRSSGPVAVVAACPRHRRPSSRTTCGGTRA